MQIFINESARLKQEFGNSTRVLLNTFEFVCAGNVPFAHVAIDHSHSQ